MDKKYKGGFPPLEAAEYKKIVDCAMNNKCPEMLGELLMLFCGLRVGEVTALMCDDINMETRNIYVHQSAHRIPKKEKTEGQAKTVFYVSEIPSQSQIRNVSIPEVLLDYIGMYYCKGRYLLTGEPDVPMEARSLRNRVDRIFDENNVERVPFQRLRKTWVKDN